VKEIDFLPEWYRHGQIKQKNNRQQYLSVILIALIMFAWSVFANARLAAAKAKLTRLRSANVIETQAAAECNNVEIQLEKLEQKQKVLDSVDSHIVVSCVLAEITHLIDGQVILKNIEIKRESFSGVAGEAGKAGPAITIADQNKGNAGGNFRYKAVLTGVAADASQVARLIRSLESSDYFIQVIPAYSRNSVVNGRDASEFEINCYLANYIQQN
jgi:Tfp pilus assembly protein PilN